MNTSTRRICSVAAAAAIVLLAAWYILLLRPQSKSLASAHKARAAAEQQASQLQSQIESLRAIYAQIPSDVQKYATLEKAVPDNPELSAAIDEIRSATQASGVQIKALNPAAPTPPSAGSSASAGSGTPSVAISMSGSGTYPQVVTFLSDLSSSPRTFVVDTLSLSGGTGGQPLSMELGAHIFYAGQPTP